MNSNSEPFRFEPSRPLGRTGFHVTALGIGDLADRAVPLEECVATARRAMTAGLNLIDTAPGYENGYSEEVVGQALKGRREGMFVVDKIDFHDEPVAPQVQGSLRRLDLESVDLFLLHGLSTPAGWQRAAAPGGAMEQLAACIRAGQARFRGISSHHPEVLRLALESGLCDVIMFPVGPYCDPRYIEVILPLARRLGVGTIGIKAFGAGKLLGDTSGYNVPLKERPRGKFSSGGTALTDEPQLPRLSVDECLHYTLTCAPDVALLGLSFPNEQDAAFAAAHRFAPLTPEQMSELRQRAAEAIAGKGPCWWNPEPEPSQD